MGITMRVCGSTIPDSFEVLVGYARRRGKTIRRFDVANLDGDPTVLTREEVQRTRTVSSRISDRELAWFLSRGATAPWDRVRTGESLACADPATAAGLAFYQAAESLYDYFRGDRPRGVDVAKISKVLHVKRPELIPILDSRLLRHCRPAARDQARRYPGLVRRGPHLYWLAIRESLIDPINSGGLQECRAQLSKDPDELVQALGKISSLRLLDILAWSISGRP
jgi:hypothetical protein